MAETNKVFSLHDFLGLNVSTTPIKAMECRQCLPLSVVQLRGKYCQKPNCHNVFVDMFGLDTSGQKLSVFGVYVVALLKRLLINQFSIAGNKH